MTANQHPLKYSIHSRLREHHLANMAAPLADPQGFFLDLGCGLGYLTASLGRGFGRVVGMDSDHSSLGLNRIRGLSSMVQGKVPLLPFRDQTFDLVLCSEMLEHLPDGLDREALGEIARVMKPSGRLLITVPSLEGLRATTRLRNLGHDDPNGGEYHFRMGYAWEEMRGMLEATPGLRIVRRRYSMFLISELFMDLLKLVYFKKNKMKEQSDLTHMKNTPLFRIYRAVFPILNGLFLVEDALLCPIFKGHILIVEVERVG